MKHDGACSASETAYWVSGVGNELKMRGGGILIGGAHYAVRRAVRTIQGRGNPGTTVDKWMSLLDDVNEARWEDRALVPNE